MNISENCGVSRMDERNITLSVDLDVQSAEKKAQQLQKEVQNIFESRNGKESPQLLNLEIQMKRNYDKLVDLRKALMDLGKREIPTEAFSKIDTEYDELLQKYSDIAKERDKLLSLEGAEYYEAPRKVLDDQLSELELQIQKLDERRALMMDSGAAYVINEETQEYKKVAAQIDAVNDKLTQQIIHYEDIAQKSAEAEGAVTSGISSTQTQLNGLQTSVRSVARLIPALNATAVYGITGAIRGITRLTELTKKHLVAALDSVKAAIIKIIHVLYSHPWLVLLAALIAGIVHAVKALGEVNENLEEIAKNIQTISKALISKLGTTAEKTLKHITNWLITILQYTGEISITTEKILANALSKVISIVSRLKPLIEDNINTLVRLNNGINEMNKTMTALSSSMAYLETAFATAFSPIITYVEPIITRFIDKLGDASNAINIFISTLAGQKTYKSVTKKEKDYAEGLNDIAKAANSAISSLAGFDKLNVISKSKNDDPYGLKKLEATFKDLPNPLADMDLYTVGRVFAIWLDELVTDPSWQQLYEKLATAGTDIATFINGIMQNPWLAKDAGKLFSNTFNSIITAINNFLITLDEIDLGQRLGEFISNALDIDWVGLGLMFSTGINSLNTVIQQAIAQFPVDEWGDNISKGLQYALNHIRWPEIQTTARLIGGKLATFLNHVMTPENFSLVGKTIGESLNTVFNAIHAFSTTAEWTQYGNSVKEALINFFSTTKWDFGVEAINKLVNGFLDMINAAVDALSEPDENGKTIVDKIADAITGLDWDAFGDKIFTIADKILNAIDKFITNLDKNGGIEKIVGLFIKFFLMKKKWENKLNEYKDLITKNGIKVIAGLAVAAKDTEASKKYDDWADTVIDRFYTALSEGKEPTDKEKQFISATIDSICEQFGIESLTPENLLDLGGFLSNIADGMDSANKDGKFDGVAKGVIDGILKFLDDPDAGSVADMIAGVKSFTDKLVGYFCSSDGFDINSPSKVMEDKVGYYVAEGIVEGVKGYNVTTELNTWFDATIQPWIDKITESWKKIKKDTLPIIKEYKKNTKEQLKLLKDNIKTINISIKDNFIDTWKKIADGIKTPLNSIITVFESFVNKIISGMNSMITNLNTFKLDLPDYLTGGGNKTFTFNAQKISSVSIPKLAQGTVIPPNMSQFLAVLGDNNKETEVVSPLSTIEQALRNVLTEQNVNVTFQVEGDPHGMFRVVQKEATSYTKRTGRLAF